MVSMTGRKLLRYRQRLNLTQTGLATKLGTTRNTIARWERNEVPIQHAKMLHLALERLVALSQRK